MIPEETRALCADGTYRTVHTYVNSRWVNIGDERRLNCYVLYNRVSVKGFITDFDNGFAFVAYKHDPFVPKRHK